ncbi:MAG: hypothetical protein IAF58_00390 [Leptolyngbya sp.]|nr:hypothetical protein [Candidatus Melainabacteria bacterium]
MNGAAGAQGNGGQVSADPGKVQLRPAQTPSEIKVEPEAQTEIKPSNGDDLSDELRDRMPMKEVAPKTIEALSFEAKDTAKRLGLWDTLVQFDAVRARKSGGQGASLQYMDAKQNLIESVLIVSQEARAFIHFVEQEISKAESINALLAARRDRALKLNTYGDLISGGITGAVGGALALGDLNHISYDTIDAAEGIIQTGLATMSLREQSGEKRIEKGLPNILARIFEPEKGPSSAYPQSVWTFLNSPPAKAPGTPTRRETLVADWEQHGFCLSHNGRGVGTFFQRKPKGSDSVERRERITGNSKQDYKVTSDLIEDRGAMLQELRSTVTRLDVIMLEILIYMRGSTIASGRPTS